MAAREPGGLSVPKNPALALRNWRRPAGAATAAGQTADAPDNITSNITAHITTQERAAKKRIRNAG
jgi:hypothetical protein